MSAISCCPKHNQPVDRKHSSGRKEWVLQTGKGFCIADCCGLLHVADQGITRRKALVLPEHLAQCAPALRQIEYMSIETDTPIESLQQPNDTIYCFRRGYGEWETNGVKEPIEAGDLLIVPKGTPFVLRNMSPDVALGLLMIVVATDVVYYQPPRLMHLSQQSLPSSDLYQPVRIGSLCVAPRVVAVELSQLLTGPWGRLCCIEIPEGGHVEPYTLPDAENLFLLSGHLTMQIGNDRFDSDGFGLNAFLAPQVPHGCINRSSIQSLQLLSVQFPETRIAS